MAEVCSNGRPGVNYSDGVKPGTRAEEVLLSVGFITAVSLLDPPLDQLTALGGATGGALLIYVAPALMALKLEVKLRAKLAPDAPYGVAARARTAALGGLLLMGLALGIIGTVCALQPRPADENPPLDSDAPARDGSHATAPQPLLVCTLPARRLPARVADLWAPSEYHMSERGAIYLGGCAANFTSLTLVFGLVRPREFDYVAQHSAARPGAAREHTPLHRPHFRHNLSWVDSLGLTVSLEGQHCDVTIAENAAWAVCPLHPSHLDVADAREHNKVGHRDVVFWHAHPREAAVVRLVLEPAASALRANNGSRAAVWSGQPLFVPPCHRIVWPRLAAWAAAWRAAGFDDVVLHARDARLCAEVVERLPGVSCTPTPSAAGALPDISRPTDHPRDYLDQALLNMVGLVQARAARYGMVALTLTLTLTLTRRAPHGTGWWPSSTSTSGRPQPAARWPPPWPRCRRAARPTPASFFARAGAVAGAPRAPQRSPRCCAAAGAAPPTSAAALAMVTLRTYFTAAMAMAMAMVIATLRVPTYSTAAASS